MQLADKELEISNSFEKINWLEEKIIKLQDNLIDNESKYNEKLEKMKQELNSKEVTVIKSEDPNNKENQKLVIPIKLI